MGGGFAIEGQYVTWRQFLYAAVNRVWRWYIPKTQISGEGLSVQCGRPTRLGAKGFEFRSKDKTALKLGPIKRLDAEAITDEIKLAGAPVPQCDREHTDYSLD